MKLTNLPKEGDRVLIFAVIVIALLLITSCGSLTTLQSCESKIESDKKQCIESVTQKQHILTRNQRIYDRR